MAEMHVILNISPSPPGSAYSALVENPHPVQGGFVVVVVVVAAVAAGSAPGQRVWVNPYGHWC